MEVLEDLKADPPVMVDYVRLPDEILTGRYDALGEKDDDGNLFISVKDTSFIWAVFSYNLQAGQRGDMVFTNVPGTFLIGASFNEWDPRANEPRISEALFTIVSIQRGDGVVRIVGQNASGAELPTAAGIVVADDASYRTDLA